MIEVTKSIQHDYIISYYQKLSDSCSLVSRINSGDVMAVELGTPYTWAGCVRQNVLLKLVHGHSVSMSDTVDGVAALLKYVIR